MSIFLSDSVYNITQTAFIAYKKRPKAGHLTKEQAIQLVDAERPFRIRFKKAVGGVISTKKRYVGFTKSFRAKPAQLELVNLGPSNFMVEYKIYATKKNKLLRTVRRTNIGDVEEVDALLSSAESFFSRGVSLITYDNSNFLKQTTK